MDMPGSFPLPNGEVWVQCEEPGVLPQLEGVAVDQRTGVLYATQEDVGLWRIPLPLGARLGISGAAVYDALVGAAAKQHRRPLTSRDARAPRLRRARGRN
jgi:hypothetical protein